jgi:twitching motility protein PilT
VTSSIEPYLRALVECGGSDLHCKVGSPPRVRIDGKLRKLQAAELTAADTRQMVAEVLREDLQEEFRTSNEADFAYSLSGVGRFRVNAFLARGSCGLVFRRVSVGAISLDDLGCRPCWRRWPWNRVAWCWSPDPPARARRPRWPG